MPPRARIKIKIRKTSVVQIQRKVLGSYCGQKRIPHEGICFKLGSANAKRGEQKATSKDVGFFSSTLSIHLVVLEKGARLVFVVSSAKSELV